MSDSTAGYAFILEFAESFVDRLAKAIFQADGVPTRFSDANATPPGPISTRVNPFGVEIYRRYLVDALLGYDISLANPGVLFLPATQQIKLGVDFSVRVPRELFVRQFNPGQVDIPDDPAQVDPLVNYPVLRDTGMYPPAAAPPVQGRLTLILQLAARGSVDGHRVTIDATKAGLDAIASLVLLNTGWDPVFQHFVEIAASKFITMALKNEVKEIDVTPLIGLLSAFDLTIRPPPDILLAQSNQQRLLGVGFNVSSQVTGGDHSRISFCAAGSDFCVQLDEGFFGQLVSRIYTDRIPKRYNLKGQETPDGLLLLQSPRVVFGPGFLQLLLQVDAAVAGLTVQADLTITTAATGGFQVKVQSLQIHPALQAFGITLIVNTVTFYLLDGLIADVLGGLFKGPVQSSLQGELNQFLQSGALAFSFNTPVRNTPLSVTIQPTSFSFSPGRALVRGGLDIR